MQGAERSTLSRATIGLVGTLAAIYLVSQFLRNSVGVIAPDLAAEIGLTAGEIGLLSSAFFFAFAAAQLPLGVAIDRYGPKRCMLVCALIAVLGALEFAIATTPAGLVTARILMGLGSSCYLMAPLALYARRFAPERFTVLAGIQIAIGTIGTLLVTAPLAWASAAIGWRATFLVVAGLMTACAVMVALVVREERTGQAPAARRETIRESLAGVLEVARMRGFASLFAMQFVTYSSYVLIVGLWGGPFLAHVYGYGLTQRGDLLMLPAISHIIGVLAWGHAQRMLGAYKPLVLGGALTTAFALGLLAIVGRPAPWALAVWLAVFGLLPAYLPVLIAHGRSLLPPQLIGRGMTLLNVGTMGGTFLVQLVSGAVIDLFPAEGGIYPLAAYRAVFAIQSVVILAACAAYITLRPPQAGARDRGISAT
jgi:predicted MFS family arabinose efflux permease